MIRFILFLFMMAFIAGCQERKIIQPEDYRSLLSPAFLNKAVENRQKEIVFWSKRLQTDTGNFVHMLELGYNKLALFQLKGHIKDLKAGDSLIRKAAQKLNYKDPDILQSLSQVSITQHRFSDADFYNEEAFRNGGSPFIHHLISFDAGMELGRYKSAWKNLSGLKDQTSFDYLIRKAKYEDHKGNLDGAIELMEQAFEKVKAGNRTSLYCWALSNLGDMYGHAGRITDAYDAYKDVLKKDPAYLYALKGLAWIAYAHDRNTAAAKEIVQFIQSQSAAPELCLTLAEIAAYEGNAKEKERYIRHFVDAAGKPEYGDMYNKYLVEVYATELGETGKALILAEKEMANRPTPETFSWLAWVYYNRGDHAKAYSVYKTYVDGRTFEPLALYKGAFIYAANNKQKEAKELREKCMESSFELGPVLCREIGNLELRISPSISE